MPRSGNPSAALVSRLMPLDVAGVRNQTQCPKKFHLVEVEVLRPDLAAFHALDRDLATLHSLSRRRDIALWGPQGAGVRSAKGLFRHRCVARDYLIVGFDLNVGECAPEKLHVFPHLVASAQCDPTRDYELDVR